MTDVDHIPVKDTNIGGMFISELKAIPVQICSNYNIHSNLSTRQPLESIIFL